jgi:aminoglycoside phosphotransferase family enzyme
MLDQRNDSCEETVDQPSAATTAAKVRFLGCPASYEPPADGIVTRETHMSWVFMTADRVYKLKKPVRFAYLDFSTLALREHVCRAECALNRRLAPDVYLGYVPLTSSNSGFAINGAGAVVDWLVVMRRLDETATLEAALLGGRANRAQIDQLASILTAFYARAERIKVSPGSYLVALRKDCTEDCRILLDPRFNLPQGVIARVVHLQRRYLDECADVLRHRVHGRHLVDGHGDLRPEHVWLSNSFPIIDCLEFNDRLRAIDALDEIAFLHLECERLGGLRVGERIRRRLARRLNDQPANGVFLFYRTKRAMLRARLSIAHLIDPHPRTPEKWPRLARSYLHLAVTDAARLERLLDRRWIRQNTRRSARDLC